MASCHAKERFAACRKAKRCAMVAFVTAGYPEKKDTVPALLELEKQGADVIELGVPFSDPMADGSAIEAASVVAIKNGAFKKRKEKGKKRNKKKRKGKECLSSSFIYVT